MRHSRTKTGQRIALTALLGWMLASVPVQVDGPTDLFFSEYIEGSSNNKALEIYNGTGAAINLGTGGYNVQMFFNGSASAGLTINLTGTVAAGDVFVLANSGAVAAILAQADQTNGAGWFNGDDAVVLRKGTTVIDVIGQVGFDPGTEWGSGLTSTADNTLRRLPTVCGGDTNGSDAFDPSVQWEGLATDTFGGLGSHTANCTAADSAPSVTEAVPANGATNVAVDASLTVTFSEAVNVTGEWFTLNCDTSGLRSPALGATVTGGPAVFTIDPTDDLAAGESCMLTVFATAVADQDASDPPNNMAANFVATFDTVPAVDPCTLPYTPIPAIQGNGPATPLLGQVVTTQGVVVGDYEGPSPALRGFFIQDPVGDGDPATSDGIFVFNGSNANSVSLGQIVRVTGTAGENQGQSQISVSSANILACGTGTVGPTDVTFPVPSDDYLERFEGMLVRLPQTMYVTEHFQLGRFGQVVLSAGGRLVQPTEMVPPGAPAIAQQAANDLNRIILDDASQAQNPDPIVFARGGQPLSASNTLRGGDTATGIVGVLNYTWAGNNASPNAYRVRPGNALGGAAFFEPTNPRPVAVPEVGGTVRVASANVLNYFNTFDGLPDTVDNCTFGLGGESADCRGADTPAEFDRQWPKTVAALLATGADVLGLIEVENDGYGADSAIQDLVNRLNAATAAGTWAFIDADAATGQLNSLGTDAIKSAILYKTAVVTPVGRTGVLNTGAFGLYRLSDGRVQGRNRPSLAQTFEAANGARVTVVVNHLVSKGAGCGANVTPVGPDPDTGDGQGACNITRVTAMQELVAWLATDPTGVGDDDYLLVGDFNAYKLEDPLAVLTNASFVELASSLLGPGSYSYVFDGQWGSLDHAFVSPTLNGQVTGFGIFHVNADEPSVLDYNTDFKSAGQIASLYAPDMYRMADHDPLVVGLDLRNDAPVVTYVSPAVTIVEGQSTVLEAIGYDPDGGPVTYAWDLDNDGTFETAGQTAVFWGTNGVGPFTVKVRVTDLSGLSATASTTVTVWFNWAGFFPPVKNPPAWNARKAGSAVPVKFSLGGDKGLAIFAAGYPVSTSVDCATGQAGTGSPTANPGNSGLSYDPLADQYNYVWKTEKAWAGTCRQLSVTLVDGSTHTAFFSFR